MQITFAAAALLAASVIPALAQPAPVLNIYREVIKEGRSAAHEKVESDYVRISRKVNHPAHYLAIESLAGPQEVWFLEPLASFAKAQEYRDLGLKEPLKSEFATLDSRDGEVRSTSRAMWAVYRGDMSYNADKLNPGKARFLSVGTYRVRLGRDGDMQAGAKIIIDGYTKANLDAVLLCYQVVSGAPSGTYLFFSPMESMATMDEMPARQRALAQAMGSRYEQVMKGAGETFISIESTLFAVNPRMSYVSKEIEDAAPDFWRPKAPKPAAAPKPAEKAGQ